MKLSPFNRGLLLALIISLLAGGVLFSNRIVRGEVFSSAEAVQGQYAMWLWHDLKSGDWGAFWYDTGRQMAQPFLHSWLLALFFFLFGVGYPAAHLLSLALFLASALLLYLLANKFCPRDGRQIGLLAVVLLFLSPLALHFALLNSSEGLGMLLFLAATYFYLVAEERKLLINYLLLALLIGLSLYTNYVYAFLMIPSFLLVTLVKLGPLGVEALQLCRKGESCAASFIWWAYRKLIVLSVFLLLAGAWFSTNFSRRLMLFLDAILRNDAGQPQWIVDGLLYYPKVIVRQLSFSPWLGLLMLLSLAGVFASSRYCGLKKLFMFVWTGLLLATLVLSAKAPQMIYIIVPFILLISSSVFFYLYEGLLGRDRRLAGLLALAVFLPALLSLPRAAALYAPECPCGSLGPVLDHFQQIVPADARAATMTNLKHFNAEVLRFHFRDLDGRVLGENELFELPPDGRPIYYLTVNLAADSPYQREIVNDSLYRWNTWLKGQEAAGEIRLVSLRDFPGQKLSAAVYQQVSRP